MPKKPKKERAPRPTGPGLAVCHGCCCARDSTGRRTPVELARAERLKRAVDAAAGRVTIIDCLGPCDYADVVVVRPSVAGRQAGGRPVWLGWVSDDDTVALIEDWVATGGPGVADMPDLLALNEFKPPRRYRDELESA